MKNIPRPPVLPRGRVAQWTRQQLEKLNKEEWQALLANAARKPSATSAPGRRSF